MAQVSATAPVSPPDGVTVMVDVLPLVAPGLTVMAPLFESAKSGGAVTVRFTMVIWELAHEAPVTVAACAPGVGVRSSPDQ